jgi:hypothetical protein
MVAVYLLYEIHNSTYIHTQIELIAFEVAAKYIQQKLCFNSTIQYNKTNTAQWG